MRLSILFSFFLLVAIGTSCRKGELIGREVQVGDNDILLNTTDSFHISSRTIEAEPQRTDERFSAMLGAYSDPVFGPNIISHFSQYDPPEEGFIVPDDAIFDSAFLSFRLTGGYRESAIPGTSPSLAHFKVYEVAQDLFLDSIYYSNSVVKTGPSVIGEFQGPVDLLTGPDGTETPLIKIPLTTAFGEKILYADPSVYETRESFTQFLKGLATIPIQTSDVTSNGAAFYFNPLSGFSGVTIHYHTDTDTTKFNLITNSLTANFTTFSHDYSQSAVGSVFGDTAIGSQQLYLQSTIGTDIQIELKDIVAKFGEEPKIINFAELYIPVDTTQEYYPIAKLSVGRKLEDGSAEFLPDQIQTGNRDIDGNYNADSAYYRFRITQYVQNIIHNYVPGEDKSEILLISPTGNNTNASRSVLYGPRPMNPSKEKLRLVITYTPLN